ncbi:pyocin knob domain-containing protein [Providencia hangzhouensis]|uniref:pyocin knob domain-containing protein n=1 Tax=Providencia hangzhouensis TaxID=3031799 RepID=UPI0034DCFFFE
MYNIGTVTTTANSTKVTGTSTKWKDNNSRVSAEQIILIVNSTTAYINSIQSIQSDTELTLSFPAPVAVKNGAYNILTTMVNSVSDAANKIVAMNAANVQFSDIVNRLATETGVIEVVLPDGTKKSMKTFAEMDKQLDGKLDKTGGTITGDITFGTDSFKSTKGTFSLPSSPGTLVRTADYGIGYPVSLSGNLDLPLSQVTGVGKYMQSQSALATTEKEYPIGGLAGTLINYLTTGGMVLQEYRVYNRAYSIYYRVVKGDGTSSGVPWVMQYNTGNTTKDANGNLKAASPVVKLFADDIELNDESEGVEMEHLGIGHYLIKGVVGFNADGAWGINNGFVIPQDHNGKNMVLIDYEVRPDGDIEVFVFHQQNADMPERFQNKRIKHFDEEGVPVYFENYEPCDVPESRWIDMRVEMPPNSLYNQKQAEAQRLAKIEAERLAQEEAKRAAEEVERTE